MYTVSRQPWSCTHCILPRLHGARQLQTTTNSISHLSASDLHVCLLSSFSDDWQRRSTFRWQTKESVDASDRSFAPRSLPKCHLVPDSRQEVSVYTMRVLLSVRYVALFSSSCFLLWRSAQWRRTDKLPESLTLIVEAERPQTNNCTSSANNTYKGIEIQLMKRVSEKLQ